MIPLGVLAGGSVTPPPAVVAYWTEVASLISTYGGVYWPMADNGAGDDLQCSLTADALDFNDSVGTPTYVTTFSSYPALRGVTADNATNYRTGGGVDSSWATTGDFTHIVAVTIPASFGTGQCLWEIDGSGAGSGASASWGRLVFDTTTAAKVVWEDSGGTQRTANFTKGAGTWASQDNYFIVTHDSTTRTWSLYEDVAGTVTLVGTDTYLAGEGPSGGVASNKQFGIMKRPTTGTNYLDTGWVLGSNIRIPDIISTSEMQSLLDAARGAQTTYFDALLTSDLEEDATKFTSTFSRASSQFTEIGGTLTEYTTNVPAFGDTGVSNHSSATNLITYSDDLSNYTWAATNCTAAAGAPTTILGRSCTKLTDSGSGGGYVDYSGISASGWLTASVYLVCSTGTVNVTLIAGDGTNTESISVTVTTTPQRFVLTSTASGWGSTRYFRIQIDDAGGVVYANLANYVASTLTCTDPIPTFGSAATRAACSCVYSVSGMPANDYSYSFKMRLHLGAQIAYLLPVYIDSSNYLRLSFSSGLIGVTKRVSGVSNTTNLSGQSFVPGTEYECTLEHSSTTGVTFTVGGVSVTEPDTTNYATTHQIQMPGGQSNTSVTVGGLQLSNLKVTS